MNVFRSLTLRLAALVAGGLVLFCSVALMLTGCFREAQPIAVTPVVKPPVSTMPLSSSVLSASGCQITQVKMPGVPDENITVNQADKSITIVIPETYKPRQFRFAYTLNSPLCYVYADDIELTVANSQSYRASVVFDSGNQAYHSKEYKVRYKPAGPLVIGQGQQPITLTIGETEPVLIHVLNYHALSDYSRSPKISMTRVSDGKVKSAGLSEYQQPGTAFSESSIMQLISGLDIEDEGTYTVQAKMADSTIVTCPQPVIVRYTDKVIVNYVAQFDLYTPVSGGTQRFNGYNLRQVSKAGIDLIDYAGQRTALPILEYRDKGREMTARIPESLKGGHYLYQPTRNGVPQQSPGHFVIADGNRPLFSYPLGIYTAYPTGPGEIRRGVTLYIRFSPPNRKTKLKLMSKADPSVVYLIDIVLSNEQPFSGFFSPTAVVPTDLPLGDYTASLQQIATDGSVIEGPAHLQTIRITP